MVVQGTSISRGSIPDTAYAPRSSLGSLLSAVRTYSPTGNTAIDTVTVQSILDSMSGAGIGVLLIAAGTLAINATITVPSNVCIIGAGIGVTVVQASLTPESDPTNAVFYARAGTATSTTALSAANTVGAETVSTNASIATGSIITINDTTSGAGLRTMSYVVQGVSGSGPYTLTLDRPVLVQYDTGDAVAVIPSQPTNIVIEGMTIQGTADRMIELVTARRCVVRNMQLLVTGGASHDICASFDVGGRDNAFIDVEVDGGDIAADGLALEGNESSRIESSRVNHVTSYGMVQHDCFACTILNPRVRGAAHGIVITADGSLKGSMGAVISGGSVYGCSSSGVSVVNGSVATTIVGVSARYNATGLAIGDALSSTSGVRAVSCDFSQSTTNAVSVNTTVTGVYLDDCDLTVGAAVVAISASGDLVLSGCRIENCKQIGLLTGKVSFSGCYMKCNPATAQNVLYLSSGTPRVSLIQCILECATSSCNMISIAAGVCTISQTTIRQTGSATGVLGMYISAGSLFIGSGVDASGCGTPLSSVGGTTKIVTETTETTMANPT